MLDEETRVGLQCILNNPDEKQERVGEQMQRVRTARAELAMRGDR
jgi:hypothetical protein